MESNDLIEHKLTSSGIVFDLPHVSEGAPQRESTRPELYFPLFDWLRITLALTVVLAHAELVRVANIANFAVQVFFSLSGWLIGGILLRTEPADLIRFYYRRATRIWIPYAVALGLLLAVSLLRDRVTSKYCEFVFYKATFVYNLFGTSQLSANQQDMPLQATGNHFWSVCAEEQFYLVAPLLLVMGPQTRWMFWFRLTALILLCLLGPYGSIAAGVLCAMLVHKYGTWHSHAIGRMLIALIGFASGGLILTNSLSYPMAAPLVATPIVLLLAQSGAKQRIAAFLGGVSYPLYLNHWLGLFIAHSIAKRLALNDVTATIWIGLPLAIGISVLLYLAVDAQIIKRRSKWYTDRLGELTTFAAFALMIVGLLGAAYFHGGFRSIYAN